MTKTVWLTKEEYEQLRQFKSLGAEPYMKVKECPGCDGTGKDNSEPEFECEFCSEGKPGWIIA